MGKKLLTVAMAVALLGGGVYLGSHLGSNNSATIVGGADRYAKTDNKTSAVSSLAASVGASGKGKASFHGLSFKREIGMGRDSAGRITSA